MATPAQGGDGSELDSWPARRQLIQGGCVGEISWLAVAQTVLHEFRVHTCRALAASTCLFSALAVGFNPPAEMQVYCLVQQLLRSSGLWANHGRQNKRQWRLVTL
jgi:hypothetical protein